MHGVVEFISPSEAEGTEDGCDRRDGRAIHAAIAVEVDGDAECVIGRQLADAPSYGLAQARIHRPCTSLDVLHESKTLALDEHYL